MRHFRRHADGFPKGWMRMNGLANVDRIRAHLNRQRNLADHVARVGTNNTATQYLAVAEGFGVVVKQQLGKTFIAAIGNDTP